MPQWNTVSISGYHIREAGSTAVQELAFTLADGFHYVDQCLERGMAIDDFAPRLSFFFNAHNDIFEEIAKYRAARVLWAEALRNKYGAQKETSWKLRFHAQTAGCSLQDKQPEVNLIRVAYQALAAVLGGCQSLHTNSMDETLALPSEHAVTLALRTQQVLAYETGVTNTVDPLGGSYFVETLTRQMMDEARKYFDQIEQKGRHDRRPRSGLLPPRDRRRRVRVSARGRRETQADRRRQRVRREGREADGDAADRRVWSVSNSSRLTAAIKARRDKVVGRCLHDVRRIAATPQNLMPALLAAENTLRVGEIMSAWLTCSADTTVRREKATWP